MREKTRDTLVDKLIDILVVIVGILLALSIDSYVDSKKQKRQWISYATQFYNQAVDMGPSLAEINKHYKEKLKENGEMIQRLRETKSKVPGMDEYLNSLGKAHVLFPDKDLYQAFLGMGNEHLLKDAELLGTLSQYFGFRELAMTNFNIFTDHFIVDYRKTLNKYYSEPDEGGGQNKDLIPILISYSHFVRYSVQIYETHEKDRQKTIEVLGPVIGE